MSLDIEFIKSSWIPRLCNNYSDIIFQAVDWYTRDEKKEFKKKKKNSERRDTLDEDTQTPNATCKIEVFGIGKNGETCSATFTDFHPYFFIQLPQQLEPRVLYQLLSNFQMSLPKYMKNEFIVEESTQEMLYSFYGYQWQTKQPFVKLVFHSERSRKKMARLLEEEGVILPRGIFEQTQTGGIPQRYQFKLYENNIEPLLRFFHIHELNPCGWLKIPQRKYVRTIREEEKKRCHIDVQCHEKYVKPVVNNESGPIMICSFDIEADSSHGDFPLAIKNYSKPANDIVRVYMWYCDNGKTVSSTMIEQWLRICFGLLDNKFVDEAIRDDLAHIYTKCEIDKKMDQPNHEFRKKLRDVATEISVLFTKATSASLHEGDSVTAKYAKKAGNFKDTILKIEEDKKSSSEEKTSSFQYGNSKTYRYILKKTPGYARLTDTAISLGDETCIRIEREGGYKEYKTMKKMEWKRRKTVLQKKITTILNKQLPRIEGDSAIQIGSVFHKYGESEPCLKHLIALGTCDPIDGIEVESVTTEKELLVRWSQLIRKMSPNVITGYNIFGFDEKFLWERADELHCTAEFGNLSAMRNYTTHLPHVRHRESPPMRYFTQKSTSSFAEKNKHLCMCREKHMYSKLLEKELNSAGLGENRLFYMDIPGIVQIDLLKVVMRDFNLSSYKLDDVASNFIRGKVLSFEYKIHNGKETTVFKTDNSTGMSQGDFIHLYKMSVIGEESVEQNRKYRIEILSNTEDGLTFTILHKIPFEESCNYQWGLAKDDVTPQDIFRLQKGSSSDRAIVGKYCVQDCQLVMNILLKLQVMSNNLGMSTVCSVPFQYIFTRGQGIKTFSLVSRECRKLEYVIPYQKQKKILSNEELMQSFEGNGNNSDEEEEEQKDTYQGAFVLPPKPGIYLDDAITVLDYSSLYPSSMISENLCISTIILDSEYKGNEGEKRLKEMGLDYVDVEYDNYLYKKKGKAFVKVLNEAEPKTVCRFVQPVKQEDGKILDKDRGIIPQILRMILSQRKATRARIKTETNPFVRDVLDGLQLAYKVTANSVYGSLGSPTNAVYFKDIAASTTSIGRKLLLFAKSFVEKTFLGSEIVYGDTDSIFINFHPKREDGTPYKGHDALRKSIELGKKAGELVKSELKDPHDLEYEKTFWPFILFSKKRYVGNKYEEDPNKFKLSYMGIVLKRRDNAQILKYMYADVVDTILNGHDIKASITILKDNIKKMIAGKFPLEYLIITKALRSNYDNPDSIVHKVLADRMGERDPGNKPQPSERIPFVYIDVGNRKITLQGDRVEHPAYIRENDLKPDYIFYITNQICKPVSQIYALVLEDLDGFKYDRDYYKRIKANLMKEHSSKDEEYVKKVNKKIEDQRMAEVKKILFDPFIIKEENRRSGNQEITKWFT